MRKGVRAIIAVLVVASLALVAGCGGDDDDATASLTKQQFIKQANAICKQSRTEVGERLQAAEKLIKPGETVKTDAGREKVVETVLTPVFKTRLEKFKSLSPPEGDEEEVEEIVEGMELAVQRLERNPLPAFYNVTQFKEANERSAAYGLKDCVA